MNTRIYFEQEIITNYDFSGKTLINANFRNASIKNCDFSRAVLINCNFGGAEITDCNFDLTYMKNIYMSRITSKWSKRTYNECNISNCTFRKAEIIGGDFGCNGENLDFSGAKFNSCIFFDAYMNNINFTSANFSMLIVDNSIIENSYFIKCGFDTALFMESSLAESVLSDITITGDGGIYNCVRSLTFIDCDIEYNEFYIDSSFRTNRIGIKRKDSAFLREWSKGKNFDEKIAELEKAFAEFDRENKNTVFDKDITNISINIKVKTDNKKNKKKKAS